MQLLSWLLKVLEKYVSRGLARSIGLGVLFIPFVIYQVLSLVGDGESPDRPIAFDVGIVTASAALGGLLLNAGVNLRDEKRKETIQVAQKFLAVVILMVISIPTLHFVGLMNIDVSSFEFYSLEAWLRGFYFWLAALSFYLAIALFIVALVDLVYALLGMDSTEHRCEKNDTVTCREDPSDAD